MQIKIHRVGVVALALLAASPAHPETYRTKMTGTQLVRDMLSDPLVAGNAVMRERAMGYIDGVMDGAAGVAWCPAKKTVAHELNYVVAEEMKGLGADRLKSPAAPLVLATLSKFYPCAIAGRQS